MGNILAKNTILTPDSLDQDFLNSLNDIFSLPKNDIIQIYNGLSADIDFYLSLIQGHHKLSKNNIEQITQAYLLGAIAHSPIGVLKKKNATRNDNTTPYFQHPIRLSIILSFIVNLLEKKIDQNALTKKIIIMLSHDIDEDTIVSVQDLDNIFGCNIINSGVNEITLKYESALIGVDCIKDQIQPQIQKDMYYQNMSLETQIFKMIDRLECFATMERMSSKKIEKQIRETVSSMKSWSKHSSTHRVLWISIVHMINQVIEYRGLNTSFLDADINNISDREQISALRIKNYTWDTSRKALMSQKIKNNTNQKIDNRKLGDNIHPFLHHREKYNKKFNEILH